MPINALSLDKSLGFTFVCNLQQNWKITKNSLIPHPPLTVCPEPTIKKNVYHFKLEKKCDEDFFAYAHVSFVNS